MLDIKIKKIKLDDIIDFSKSKSNGSFFTKTLINQNKGSIPVYGASKNEFEVGYGYVVDNLVITNKLGKELKVKYFEDCLTWNIDGSIAIFYRAGRFSLSEKVIPLVPFEKIRKNLDLKYIRFIILQNKEITKFHFSNKAGKNKLKDIEIVLPIKDNGEYDLEEQIRLREQYEILEEKKSKLLNYLEKLQNSIIEGDFASKYTHKDFKITELFIPKNGDGRYTKEFCVKNKGDYPVYSGNTNEEFEKINEYSYEGKYLTWAKDGLAGYMMLLDGKFSITNHRGILIPTELGNELSLEYIKFILEPIFRKKIKGRTGHNGENEYTTLNKAMIEKIEIKVPVPIKENGRFDLDAQIEIANKYKEINAVIEKISSKIKYLLEVQMINL